MQPQTSNCQTVSEYCRHLVQRPDLASKLAPPRQKSGEPLTLDRPAPELWLEPVRAPALKMTGKAPKLPKLHTLQNPEARAKCLHRFAHHELQAVELFAWAILRWPDMPDAMKRGFLNTIAEEQKHLSLYLERLEAHGVRFGDLGLSDYFWRHVPTLDQSPDGPKAFLAAMGLTLEQANLDFTLMYKDAFAAAGDAQTAAVLQLVHDEEIGHVRLAKTWLNKLQGRDDDLGNYLATAPFPFGATRAKGRQFHRAPREKATLSPAFITHVGEAQKNWVQLNVELYGNFGAEEPETKPEPSRVKPIQKLFELFWQQSNRTDDVHPALLSRNALLPATLEPFLFPWLANEQAAAYAEQKNRILWGPTPDLVQKWHPKHRAIQWAKENQPEMETWTDDVVIFNADYFSANNDESFGSFLTNYAQTVSPRFTLKPNWGFSGRGRVGAEGLEGLAKITNAAKRMCSHKGGFVLEPWFERVQDYSVLLWIPKKGDVRVRVLTLLNTAAGVYGGHENQVPNAVRKQLKQVGRRLADDLRQDGYVGPAGLDAFTYKKDGKTHLRSTVEINARMTLGHLAWWVFSSLGNQQMRFAFHPKFQDAAPDWSHEIVDLFEDGPRVFMAER